ncbi:hypothetical protein V6N13_089947 [Hibiscus sabdariffa]
MKREKSPAAKFGGDFGGVATFANLLLRLPTFLGLTYVIYKILVGLICCFCFGVNWVKLELSKVIHLF